MGKSTNVPLDKRVSIWVELVPRLLEHLSIKHVALMSHSAGTVFLLNTLVECRDILHPTKPFVALLGIYRPLSLLTLSQTWLTFYASTLG